MMRSFFKQAIIQPGPLLMTRSGLIFSCLFFLLTQGLAAPRFAVASGNWNGAIWATTVGGVAGSAVTPTNADAVTINATRVVTVNVAAVAQSVTVNGTLSLSGTQDITITNANFFTVNNGGIVNFASGGQILGGGSGGNGILVTIAAGARLNTANTLGFTTSASDATLTGSIAIRTGSRGAPAYNAGADYQYNGTAGQVTGNAIVAARDIFITNTSAAVTNSVSLAVSGSINLNASTTFASAATTVTLSGAGTPLSGSGSFTATTGTAIYSGASPQNIKAATYYNLTFSGNGDKTIPTGGTVTVGNNWTTGIAAIALSGTANVTVAANITGSAPITIGSGTLTANGADANAFANTGTFTPGTGTVAYNRSGTQTVRQTVYNNLTLGGTSAKTTNAVTVDGILSMEGTATATATPTYGTNATLRYNRTANQATGPEWPANFPAGTLTGGVIINNTGDITLDAGKTLGEGMPLTLNSGGTALIVAQPLTLTGNFINSGGTVSGAAGIGIVGGDLQSIGALAVTGPVTVMKTDNEATFTGNVSGAGPLVISNTGTGILNLGAARTHSFSTLTWTSGELASGTTTVVSFSGAVSYTAGNFTPSTSTVNFTGAAGQTIPPVTYYNLGFSGAGTKTIATGDLVTVNNNWAAGAPTNMDGTGSITVAATINGTGAITMGSGTLTANGSGANAFANSGTFTRGTGTVAYNRAGTQTVRQTTYTNLTLGGTSAKTTTTVTVQGILSMEGSATASVVPTYGTAATLRYNRTGNQATGAEWPAGFTAGTLTGGVIIENTGDITLATAAKVLGTGMSLTVNADAALILGQNLTLNANLINNGGDISGTGNVTITGASAQLIGAFTTTGTVTSSKSTASTATFTGNVSGGPLVINNAGTGILNLGTGFTHAFTNFTRTLGTLQGNTSVLNMSRPKISLRGCC